MVEEIELTPAPVQWDPKNTAVSADKKPRIKLSSDFNQKFRAANKIKNKYKEKTTGNRGKKSTSRKWLKSAGYFDTKDQDDINYIYLSHRKTCPKMISLSTQDTLSKPK